MRNRSECFNANWKFCAGNVPRFEEPGLDDTGWTAVNLPHDWSIGQPFDSTLPHGSQHAYLPNGVVNYRKRFRAECGSGERLLLDFDGVYRSADLFVNGRHILKHFNGYTGFEADITDALVPGENLVAVRADNSIEQTSRWYTGSGINRSVRLRRIGPLHFLRHGLVIDAKIDGHVRIAAECSLPGNVLFTIHDPSGKRTAAHHGPAAAFTVGNPQLWSPDTPNLYTCTAQLFDETGAEADRITAKFGFRSVEFDPEHGFVLNGKKLLLRGVNIHEDLCGIGTAVFRDGVARRYRILKSLGVNAVRLAHHPYAPEYLELADEMGLLIFDEAFDKWTGQYYGYQVAFEDHWRGDVAEFVRRDRNHPSVFLWSVGNEVVDQQLDGQDGYGVDRLIVMRDFVHKLDPTRKVTCALYPSRRSGVKWDHPDFREKADIHQMAHHMDVVAANYMGEYFARDHVKYPQMTFLVSEATTNRGVGSWFDFDHELGGGSFYWGGFDYLGEARWPHKNWYSGLIDRAGYPKSIAYQAQIAWDPAPRIHIAVHADEKAEVRNWNDVQLEWENMRSHWNWKEGETVRVAVYTNCERVVLLLNGRPVGSKVRSESDCCRIPFEFAYAPGELTANGYNGDKLAATGTLATAGKPVELRLRAERTAIAPDGLGHVEIALFDAAGTRCAVTDAVVHLRVSGDGSLFGVSNGDTTSPQPFKSNAVRLFEGRALAVVRAGLRPGECRLRAVCEIDGAELASELAFSVG
ncbi:glycoside hydrolase family 2 TIM barrel-domain containing protein [uncultured Victivallis sp.]|uniref:glycoside hydrolase family 2 protein n=1 Tax=uncultured Victivallis sp. TaxID=354118 RepID=UPI00258992AB|nr:glycoside hydrolase family 2 TIM barrel-domain containing protein [uncultured Victivallis sp.]